MAITSSTSRNQYFGIPNSDNTASSSSQTPAVTENRYFGIPSSDNTPAVIENQYFGIPSSDNTPVVIENWFTIAQDGLTLETRTSTAGGGFDLPLGTPALEVGVGAEVQFRQQTRGDGSVLITAQLSGEIGLELAEIAEIGANGQISTQYRFDNQ